MNQKCPICKQMFIQNEKGIKKYYCSKKCSYRGYYIENKEAIKKKTKDWALKNPEKVKKNSKKSMKKYIASGKMNEAMKKYYNKNIDKCAARGNSYYHKKEIFDLKNNECELCKSKNNLQIHHKEYTWTKKHKLKSNLYLNIHKLMLLCKSCHTSIHKN